jgi:hypothetical protein
MVVVGGGGGGGGVPALTATKPTTVVASVGDSNASPALHVASTAYRLG